MGKCNERGKKQKETVHVRERDKGKEDKRRLRPTEERDRRRN